MMKDCFAYDEELASKGHIVGGAALLASKTAATLRPKEGKVTVTDGQFAEAKEMIGGILFIEAKDLQQAVELMSKHPSLRYGCPWEIRPTNPEIEAILSESLKKYAR